MTQQQAPDAEPAIVAAILKQRWATQQQIDATREAISSRRLTGPIHHALFQQRLLKRDQCDKLDEILHRNLIIGRFQVQRKLGSGAMGDVFLATDGDERVAIKIIAKRFADDDNFVRRFDREIAALTHLQHSAIAAAIEFGRHDGLPYLAMQYIEGPSLSQLLQKHGPLPETYVLRITMQVALGLDYVFGETKLVHRDIKPENILIVPEVGGSSTDLYRRVDRAVLIDFGLARSFAEDERLTMTGITMGTPHYMSPEQIRGSQDLDARSDIYGLGATAFHLLTGRTPYKGSSPGAVMTAHLTEAAPDPRELVPALSEATRSLVMMCLAKDPGDRYLSHQALAKACELALDSLHEDGTSALRLLRKPLVLATPNRSKADRGEHAGKGTERMAKGAAASPPPATAPAMPPPHAPANVDAGDDALPDLLDVAAPRPEAHNARERILQKREILAEETQEVREISARSRVLPPVEGGGDDEAVEDPSSAGTVAMVPGAASTGAVAYPEPDAPVSATVSAFEIGEAEDAGTSGEAGHGTEALRRLHSDKVRKTSDRHPKAAAVRRPATQPVRPFPGPDTLPKPRRRLTIGMMPILILVVSFTLLLAALLARHFL